MASECAALTSSVTLNTGFEMPVLGLGTYKAKGVDVRNAVKWAIEAGYRHIDTASIYRNEEDIAEAIRDSRVARESLFITSKVSPYQQGYEKARKALQESLTRLGTDYLDLYLVHWPGASSVPVTSERNVHLRHETWRAMEEAFREGRCRSIGVSNFLRTHLEELLSASSVVPAVNQIEVHPYLTQEGLREFCASKGIRVEAYSPLGCGELLSDATVVRLAHKFGRTPAQVLLRWGLQTNLIVIPKSVTKERIEENARVFDFDFELEGEDVASLLALNKNERFCWSPEGVR
ncbi:Aldo/keto reductase family protein [Klebsormidium nitens]|uniref:Aldo/keto reductase family protein n=1 Tax=Klebsormidium nitens TaxID=105231 RepID=A0A0U9I6S7_KLENI|nr:Aldo/keto reductase family protein [Klebsormidium nitens]|eukprot:GAQ80986.1 Aldo/keto reductase family protein [Klebsormidium nitens]